MKRFAQLNARENAGIFSKKNTFLNCIAHAL